MSGAIDLYTEVAKRLPSSSLIFLNYGYADAAESHRWIAPADQCYKHHLSLVRYVMSGVELAGRTVLEVGSGRGGNCYYLSRYTQAKMVCGVDLCEANIRFCQRAHHLPNVTFLRGDAEALPFRSEAFEVVLNLESSHNYPHFERFLAEAYRVLKPKGLFCYADIWFLKFSDLDWKSRKKALDVSPFILLAEEDISEPVFQALKSEHGFVENLRRMTTRTDRKFIERLVQGLELARLTLAAGRSSYMMWRFQKP